ncbi:MAG: hypothetical protein ACE5HT_00985 [Gemmatimonadales bacterium]
MKIAVLLLAIALAACTEGNPENNPVCGISSMAAASMALEQFATPGKLIQEVPEGVEGVVPAKVVGYGTARAITGRGPGGLILGYEGEGFPKTPGFGILMVEDSLDTFKGVLIYDIDPPQGILGLGSISSSSSTIPLFGLRVNWSSVSSERCPLFAPIDTTTH